MLIREPCLLVIQRKMQLHVIRMRMDKYILFANDLSQWKHVYEKKVHVPGSDPGESLEVAVTS